MLANYLKRKEHEARNPETVVKLKEAHRLLAEKDEAIAEKDEDIAKQRRQINQLRHRLGLKDDDC